MKECTIHEVATADHPECRKVIISGPMTILYGLEIKDALAKALAGGESLLLDMQEVTEIDLVGLQAICATHLSSMARGKSLTVIRSNNPAIQTVAETAGFVRHAGCKQDTGHTCVWTGGGQ